MPSSSRSDTFASVAPAIVAALGYACSSTPPLPLDLAVVPAPPAQEPPQAAPVVPPVAPPADAGVDAPAPTSTSSDGIKNGSETDIDCGGPDPVPRCALGQSCGAASDCLTRHCADGMCALLAPSCTGAAGTVGCGLAGDDNCCASLPVPGGSYLRYNDAAFPATVSTFELDRYQITVGRLRAFFLAKGGNVRGSPPAPGAGAHPKVPNSGWRSSFNIRLPGSWGEIHDRLGAPGCARGGDNTDGGAATWTPAPGPYEDLPITCIDWYTLFAFCAWDGGRLPTDAEWGYAAQGGDEQRYFAWLPPSDPSTPRWGVHNDDVATALWDPDAQVYKYTVGTPFRAVDPLSGKVVDGPAHMAVPGRKKGRGRWGHADLAGNVLEFLLDEVTQPIPEGACDDCAFVAWPDPPAAQLGLYPPQWHGPEPEKELVDGHRSLRGGSWDPTHTLYTTHYYQYAVMRTYYAAGGRCARD
ncbi:MAG: SUMF1/EgtB/PvdO family nonheme iron enzyme [Labilithrix sp.]|nr:SUMF1/EgtB/PvdO family nonheme iron enzyme [Labilithrix sp.]